MTGPADETRAVSTSLGDHPRPSMDGRLAAPFGRSIAIIAIKAPAIGRFFNIGANGFSQYSGGSSSPTKE